MNRIEYGYRTIPIISMMPREYIPCFKNILQPVYSCHKSGVLSFFFSFDNIIHSCLLFFLQLEVVKTLNMHALSSILGPSPGMIIYTRHHNAEY